ncbi:hypothetical protein GW17_00047092 [Ensete ventricosum]|nr:hypothetical protein GW17_00047092 [Ensete ventricosum]
MITWQAPPYTGWLRVGAAPVASLRAADPCSLTAYEQPLAGIVLQLAALAGTTLQEAVPAGAYRPCGLATTDSPLCKKPWPQPVDPLQGALATVSHPLVGGQDMAARPCRRPGRGWPPILLLAAFAAKT